MESFEYTDYDKLDKDQLIWLVKQKDKVIETYSERAEKLDEYLNRLYRDELYGSHVLDELNRLANELPIIMKD